MPYQVQQLEPQKATDMVDVFISYSRKDIEFTQRLHHEKPETVSLGWTDRDTPDFSAKATVKSKLQEPQIAAGKKAYLFFGNRMKTGQICLGCRYRLIPSAS
ncbi:MAG: hypothetical protein VCF25_31475 [Candidatus Poribacteria bacterium]